MVPPVPRIFDRASHPMSSLSESMDCSDQFRPLQSSRASSEWEQNPLVPFDHRFPVPTRPEQSLRQQHSNNDINQTHNNALRNDDNSTHLEQGATHYVGGQKRTHDSYLDEAADHPGRIWERFASQRPSSYTLDQRQGAYTSRCPSVGTRAVFPIVSDVVSIGGHLHSGASYRYGQPPGYRSVC